MHKIQVFRAADGRITIRWPKGQLPDEATVKRLFEAIKSPSTNGNSQKGSTENGTAGQAEYTASSVKNQELETLFQQLTYEEKQAVLKRMREMKEGRA